MHLPSFDLVELEKSSGYSVADDQKEVNMSLKLTQADTCLKISYFK
jgi:hypothetical protein